MRRSRLLDETCTPTQQQTAEESLAAARELLQIAIDDMDGAPRVLLDTWETDTHRYGWWLGEYADTRYDNTLAGYRTTAEVIDAGRVTFDCSCDNEGWFAYIYPNRPQVFLCPVFWNRPLLGIDSRAGTLVHELSHLDETFASKDHVYGTPGVQRLARNDPAKAVKNADSIERFTENTPELSMPADTDLPVPPAPSVPTPEPEPPAPDPEPVEPPEPETPTPDPEPVEPPEPETPTPDPEPVEPPEPEPEPEPETPTPDPEPVEPETPAPDPEPVEPPEPETPTPDPEPVEPPEPETPTPDPEPVEPPEPETPAPDPEPVEPPEPETPTPDPEPVEPPEPETPTPDPEPVEPPEPPEPETPTPTPEPEPEPEPEPTEPPDPTTPAVPDDDPETPTNPFTPLEPDDPDPVSPADDSLSAPFSGWGGAAGGWMLALLGGLVVSRRRWRGPTSPFSAVRRHDDRARPDRAMH